MSTCSPRVRPRGTPRRPRRSRVGSHGWIAEWPAAAVRSIAGVIGRRGTARPWGSRAASTRQASIVRNENDEISQRSRASGPRRCNSARIGPTSSIDGSKWVSSCQFLISTLTSIRSPHASSTSANVALRGRRSPRSSPGAGRGRRAAARRACAGRRARRRRHPSSSAQSERVPGCSPWQPPRRRDDRGRASRTSWRSDTPRTRRHRAR